MTKWPDKSKPVATPKDWERGYCARCKRDFDYEIEACPDCIVRTIAKKKDINKAIADYIEWKEK